MEEKKFDKNSIIGFALIFIIVMYMMFNSQKEAQKEQAEKAKKELLNKVKKAKEVATKSIEKDIVDTTASDTAKLQKLQSSLGAFAYSATLPSAKNDFKIIENDLVYLKIANKGGYIVEAKLKKFEKFK
ncbi:MAG: Membrane protein insertase YidC, partial [Bacteroidota bacterium]